MPKLSRKYLLIIIIVFSFTLSMAGPESIGSGSYIIQENFARLVDFFQLEDADRIKLDEAYSKTVGSHLSQPTEMYFDNGEFPDDPAFNHFYMLLNKWMRINFVSNLYVLQPFVSTVGNVKWKFVDNFQSDITAFYMPPHLPPLSVKAVAQFSSFTENKSVIEISRSIWNRMPLQDQIGLLLHETYRNIQLGQQFKFDEDFLQKVTTIMMVCEPNIEISNYIYKYLLNYKEFKDVSAKKFTYEILISESLKNCTKDFAVPYHKDSDDFDKKVTEILRDTIQETIKKSKKK